MTQTRPWLRGVDAGVDGVGLAAVHLVDHQQLAMRERPIDAAHSLVSRMPLVGHVGAHQVERR